ncbi:MAG: hypothetical protein ACR2H3_14950 [Acidimicrobiales bacterium]
MAPPLARPTVPPDGSYLSVADVERPVAAGQHATEDRAQRAWNGHYRGVEIAITGFNPPGRAFCRPDGSEMAIVHVGVQMRRDPSQLAPADVA